MITFEHVSITQKKPKGARLVVEDVSFSVEEGEIFGIASPDSNATGTLLRAVNALIRPTTGDVVVNGKELSRLSQDDIPLLRHEVGMVFSSPALLHSKTLGENIALPLLSSGKSHLEIEDHVREMLSLTGLSGLHHAKLFDLSPEQQMRGALARALASGPKILLCEDITRSLEPSAADNLLSLLKEIHRSLSITLLITTREMDVVKQLCGRAAIMDGGKVAEINETYSLFSTPHHPFTKEFVAKQTFSELPEEVKEHAYGTIVRIEYTGDSANEPVLYETAQRFGVEYNILQGRIEYIGGKALGKMYISFNAEPALMHSVLAYLKENTYRVEVVQDV